MEMDDAVDTDDEQLILNSSNNPAFILYGASLRYAYVRI